ncbi:ubiquitin carboxyl-terminal hydrolase MINDY-2 isoform X3 [Cavia porcellus]|uniref:ubiquitin carboxyl-terminal hydrolase MINDY-2 isoform X3 n=1 Tax=Cavia porcellus TaxID=10141 RepID=UPI002FE00C68
MESGPTSPQPLGHGVATTPAPEDRQENRLAAADGPRARATESGGAGGQGAAAGTGSFFDPASPAGSSSSTSSSSAVPGADSREPAEESAAAPAGGRREVTARPEPAAAGDARTCPEEPRRARGACSSGSDPSPPEDSPSLDSLESFSNLHSFPSSSEFNSEEGAESRIPEEEQEGAAGAPGAAPLCRGEDEDDAALGPAATKERFPGQSVYHIKWIQWKEENTPIITQNENGPCPLLAILNVLLLAWKVKLPPMMEIITAEQLMEYLGDYMLEAKPKEISEIQRLNYEQNMSDAMAILHKLQTGLDVNVKFTGVRVFEYTPECVVFDLLDIPLYHGWLVDPQTDDAVKAVGSCSYNQLVEKIIFCKQSDDSQLVSEGFVAEQFLNNTATQLTYHGLCELTSAVQEGELCVFFRNNHFSTMTKHKDYLMALSLQQEQQNQEINWEEIPEGISDLELAKKLQEEEDRRASQFYQEQERAAAAAVSAQPQGQSAQASPSSGRQPAISDRKRKEPREKDKEKEKEKTNCVIL